MTQEQWAANQAKAIALVEASRAAQLEQILDKRCPGSRQSVDARATDLAAGIENRLAGSVPSPNVKA
jgi:hypothetical protein